MVGNWCRQGCSVWSLGLRAGQTRSQETGTVCKGLARTKRLKTDKLVVRKRLIVFCPSKDSFSIYFLSTRIEQSSTSGRWQDRAGVGKGKR